MLNLYFKYKDILSITTRIQIQMRTIDDGFVVVNSAEEAEDIMQG